MKKEEIEKQETKKSEFEDEEYNIRMFKMYELRLRDQ
jgi:hypothetical protein